METLLDKKLQKYFLQLNENEKKSILSLIKTFIANKIHSSDIYSIEQYNQELIEAEAEIEKGNFVSQEELEKMAHQW